MDENNLDYKKMFENLMEQVLEKMNTQKEYFDLLQDLADHPLDDDIVQAVNNNMLQMNIEEQIIMLKSMISFRDMYEYFYKKYNLEIPKKEDEEDELDA